MAEILIDGVSKVFRRGKSETIALSEAHVELPSHQVTCIVGPSGCGKTTLLNLIAGFMRPTRGEVRVDGHVVRGPSAERAVVFQSDAVFPWLTVRRNIEYGCRAQGLSAPERRERTGRFMELVGLDKFAAAYPKELSGGMRKRVDLARAYASNPEVLLLDEPFGALDVFTRETMWLALGRVVQAEPKSIVFVTHDIEEAIFLGDRVVVMTPRPARVHSILDIPFGPDRDLELRAAPEFQQLRNDISHSLREVHRDAA